MRTVATETDIKETLERFLRLLQRVIGVEAIILYGSYVNGAPDEWSDFDIAVISPDFENLPMWKRQELLAHIMVNCDSRISPIGYPSSEYHSPGPHSFLREIIRTGKVVYQAIS
ncbi:MAG: nucleotidyltransferase domain-containing protein [Chloroflexi bacterium]|nr:nucleotidyltransferase domain-containing protein [Chloroflexota bacterium]